MFEYKGVQHAVKFKPFSEFNMLRLGNGNSSYFTPALLRHFGRRLDLLLEAELGYAYDDIFRRWLPEGFDPTLGVGPDPSDPPRISEADGFWWPRGAGDAPQQPADAELSLPVWLRTGAEPGAAAAARGAAGQAPPAGKRPGANVTWGAGGRAGRRQANPKQGSDPRKGAGGAGASMGVSERALGERESADVKADRASAAKAAAEQRAVVVMTVGPESRLFLPMISHEEEMKEEEQGGRGGRGRRRRSIARPADPDAKPPPARETDTIVSSGAAGNDSSGAPAGGAQGAAGSSPADSAGAAGGAAPRPPSLAAWLSAKVGLGRGRARAAGADTALHPAERGGGQASHAKGATEGLPAEGAGLPGVRSAGAARGRGVQSAVRGSDRAGHSSRGSSTQGDTVSRDSARMIPKAKGRTELVDDEASLQGTAGKQGRGRGGAGAAAAGTTSGLGRGAPQQQQPWWEDEGPDALVQDGAEIPGRDRPRAATVSRPVAGAQRPRAGLGSGPGKGASAAGGAARDRAPSDEEEPYSMQVGDQGDDAGVWHGTNARRSAAAGRGSSAGGAARASAQHAGGRVSPRSGALRRRPPAADSGRAGTARSRSRDAYPEREDRGMYIKDTDVREAEPEDDDEDAWEPPEPAGGANTRRARRSESSAADARPGAGRPLQRPPFDPARASGSAAREADLRRELGERGGASGSGGGPNGAARLRAAKRPTGGEAARQRGAMRQQGKADQFRVNTPRGASLSDAGQGRKAFAKDAPSEEGDPVSWRGGRQGMREPPEATREPRRAAADKGEALGRPGGRDEFLSA